MEQINLTPSQATAFLQFKHFIRSEDEKVLIIDGPAGTGKTTLIKNFVDYLNKKKINFELMAFTGRAAIILSRLSGHPASTIHKQIYKFKGLNRDIKEKNTLPLFPEFVIGTNTSKSIFIIDEASLIGDNKLKSASLVFGSGELLSDLFLFAPNAKFIFIGDSNQLPPIQEKISPALNVDYLKTKFKLQVQKTNLTEIVRQNESNALLGIYGKIIERISTPPNERWHRLPFLKNCKNIKQIPDKDSLIERYVQDIKENEHNHAIFICRTNKETMDINQIVRKKLQRSPNALQKGDILMITQNNLLSGLMNGDMVKIITVGEQTQRVGLTFRKLTLEHLDTHTTYKQYLIEETLYQLKSILDSSQQMRLYVDYYNRMKQKNISQKDPKFNDNLFKDEYLNALQASFGYAITCNKAQGGEWENVYLSIPRKMFFQAPPESYHWLYTAFTRAKHYVYILDDFWSK